MIISLLIRETGQLGKLMQAMDECIFDCSPFSASDLIKFPNLNIINMTTLFIMPFSSGLGGIKLP